jgi:hypothetical protein
MHPLALTIIICGLVLIVTYLVLLLPTERKVFTTREAFEHSMHRLRDWIAAMRREPK